MDHLDCCKTPRISSFLEVLITWGQNEYEYKNTLKFCEHRPNNNICKYQENKDEVLSKDIIDLLETMATIVLMSSLLGYAAACGGFFCQPQQPVVHDHFRSLRQ
jgi:hypothetical protein